MKTYTRREKPQVIRTRTIKISDLLHHKLRVLSVQKRIPLQDFTEAMLVIGLKKKKLYDDESEQTPATA